MDHAFQRIFQLPHVARPGIRAQAFIHTFGQPGGGSPQGAGELVEKAAAQKFNIALPFPQRGNIQGKDIQAVEQIFPKFLPAHGFFQVPVGRRDHPHIDLPRVFASYPAQFSVLEQTQQRNLRVQGHFSYFVQKDGSVVRQFKLSGFAKAACAGKRPLVVSEQLGLNQIARQGPAVDHNKRPHGARPAVVYGLGKQLLSCSAFPENQRRGVASCGESGRPYRLLHRGRLAHNMIKGIDRLCARDPGNGFLDASCTAQRDHSDRRGRNMRQRQHAGKAPPVKLKHGLLIPEKAVLRHECAQDIGGADNIFQRAPHRSGLQPEHGAGAIIHELHSGRIIQHDHAFVQHFQYCVLFPQHSAQAQLFGYGARCAGHHAARMSVPVRRGQGHIEHARHTVSGVKNRSGGTEPVMKDPTIVFFGKGFHRGLFHNAGADGIGARTAFRRKVARGNMRDGVRGGFVPQ